MGNGLEIFKIAYKDVRIIHTCLRYPPATGGVETYVQQLVERTRDIAAGRDVRVLTSKMRTHGPVSELDPELLVSDPPYVQRLHRMITPLVSYPRLQALQYYIGHHRPDVIHGYSFWYYPADGGAKYARKHNIPFILHPIFYENEVRRKPIWQLYKNTIGRSTFAAADIVAVISPHEQSLIEKTELPVKRFELIPPGVDIVEFERPRQNPYLKQKIKGRVLLTVSRVAPGKGLEELIAVFPEILRVNPDVQLAIAGEDFGLQRKLTEQAERLGITQRMHFLGNLSREQLVAAFQHATVFIHPTEYEAFGIAVVEAQAAGIPVVARNIAAIPYVTAPSNHVGLFTTSDELIQRITDTFALHPTARAERTRQAQQYIAENFSWDSSIKKVTDLYSELVTLEARI